MMDFGFRRVEVRLLETVLSCDSRGFIDLLSCPEEDVDPNINSIADYCLVDSAALTELVIGMRSAIKGRR